MPELPEVETVCRGLAPHMEGRLINHVDQRRADLRFPFPKDFALRLQGREILAIDRRAKYILVRLDDETTWMIHLGMSGRFTVNQAPSHASSGQSGHNSGWAIAEKHDHVIVTLSDGGRVVFNDPRRFGFMDLIAAGEEDRHPSLKELGPEPLSDAFNADYFTERLRNRNSNIKATLLDQKIVAGLGNIYVCEALWRAGISPKRKAASVAGKRAERLVPIIKGVLQDAIAAGGSSLRDFRQADGELGYFQHQWDVYGREGEACGYPDCGGTVNRLVQSSRSTFYCPKHQR